MEFDNLITSPFGFGEKLILELLKKGESVFAVFPNPKDVPMSFLGKKNIKYGFSKLDQDPILERILPKRVKHVFHTFELYGGKFSRVFKANTLVTLLLLEWSKNAGIESFIYMSSGEVYGRGADLDENKSCAPHGFYATTKYQAEMLLKFYQRFFKINTVRLFFPFGRDVEQGYMHDLAEAIKSGETADSPYSEITPTFTDDIIEPLLRTRDQKDSTTYNICGSPVSVDELAGMIVHAGQISTKKVQSSHLVLAGRCSKAKDLLHYKETPLAEAIQHSFAIG